MTAGARLQSFALLAVSLLFSFVLAEGAVRVFARFDNDIGASIRRADPMAVMVRPHGAMGYRQKPGAVFTYFTPRSFAHANALGYRGPEVATPKPAGTFRIVLFGESSTHGWGVEDSSTIDTYMRREFAQRFPGRAIDVVNLAFDGYDAYQIWQRLLTDGFPLQPDLVIVNAGVNDVRNARFANLSGDPDPRTVLWRTEMDRLRHEQEEGGPSLWTRAKHWLYLARTVGVIRTRRQQATNQMVVPATQVHPEAMANFERNLGRIADTLAGARIPLLLSTPPSALLMTGVTAEMLPRSYWLTDAASTQHYRDSLNARLRGIVRQGAANGAAIGYVPHSLPPTVFLDDCHLNPDGNRLMADDFVAAATPFLSPHR